MRVIHSLKVVMYQLEGLLGPAIACCPSTSTSNHTLAVATSSRPSKNSKTASSVSANALLQVWLMNQVASPTLSIVSACAISSLARLPRLRDVRGLMTVWHTCSTVKRPNHGPSVDFSQRRYRTAMPCSVQRYKCERCWATARTSEGKSWLAAAAAGACCSALAQVSHTAYPAQQPATLHTSHWHACSRSVNAWQMRHMTRCTGALPPPLANGTSTWPLGHCVA